MILTNFFKKSDNKIKSLNVWDNMSYYYRTLVAPSVPSNGDLKNYTKVLIEIPEKSTILILGVTPKIRELLQNFGGKILMADFSNAMRKMSDLQLGGLPENLNETFIRTDWLNLSKIIDKNSVDVILGDLAIGNIGPRDLNEFFNNLNFILRPGGSFITRIKLYNRDWANVPAIEIVRKGHKDANSEFRFDNYLHYRFGDKVLNTTDFSFYYHDFIPLFEQALKLADNPYERAYIMRRYSYYKRFDTIRSYPSEEALMEILNNHGFTVNGKFISGDYEESEFFPVFWLNKAD